MAAIVLSDERAFLVVIHRNLLSVCSRTGTSAREFISAPPKPVHGISVCDKSRPSSARKGAVRSRHYQRSILVEIQRVAICLEADDVENGSRSRNTRTQLREGTAYILLNVE